MNKTECLKIFFIFNFLAIFFILFPSSALAATTSRGCETDVYKWGVLCNWDPNHMSWSNLQANGPGACVIESTTACPNNTASSTWSFSCQTNNCVLTCRSGYTNCTAEPRCRPTIPAPTGCHTYNTCSNCCSTCSPGYSKSGACGTCVQATLNLGVSSVGASSLINGSSTSSLMYINNNGAGVGTNNPSSIFHVVGVTTLSDDLSMVHNKSIKLDSAGSNTTLLIGNYGDGMSFGYGASTTRTASLVVEGDVKGNRLCIKEDCRAEWSDIQGTSYWTASSTYIYNNNSGNVGIGDNEPYNKLSVGGNITGSGSLVISGTATSSNYFVSNLGVGGLPNGFWNKFVDLSGSGNSAYIVKTGSINAVVAASDSGTPAGTGYNFTHSGQQMVLGTVTNQPLNFITNGTSKMFLSADGKLGIGTTSPAEMLDVNGGTRIGTINNATGDIVTVSSSGVIQKRTTEEVRDDIGAAKEINSLYYVEGNTTGTAGTWTGNIDGLDAYYDGLTIAYKIGIAGASGLTLNINNLGAKAVRRNNAAMTSHLPVGTVVVLTYTTISSTGYWVWADYDAGESYYYLRWNYANVTAGARTTRYKIIMEGHDGRFYPLTIGDSTSANGKTVSSAKFKMNGQVLWHVSTTVINENAPFTATNLYSDYYSTVANYTFNQVSGWIANKSVYLVGTIDNDGYFVLDGAGSTGTGFLSQDLPTTDDGKIYILLGYMTNNTSGFKLTPDRVAYHYKDGKIRLYETMSGTGSSNYITKWTGSTALGSSNIYNDGSSVGINTTTPEAALEINGNAIASSPTNSKHLATKGYVDSAVATTSNSLWKLNSNDLYASSTNWNVGIGTTSPLAKLDVDGSLSVRGSVAFSGPLYINGGSRLLMVDNAGNVSATTTQASVSMPAGTNGQTLRYGTSAWEATSTIFVKDGGNVGIGTTSPSSRLSLYGTPTIAGGITFNSTNTGFFSGSANEINAALNGSTEFRLNANFLDLYDNSRLRLVNEAPSATNPVFVPYGNDDDTGLGYAATNTLSLIANGVNGLNINSLGYAGIGTTTPGYKLDVNGTARFTGTVKVATPTDASDAVTKSYLDSALITSTSSLAYVKKIGDTMSGTLAFTAGIPTAAINLNGNNIVDVRKINVVIIDPLYDIGGTKYSTYAPSIVGPVKEEYVGKGEISQCDDQVCSWRLNFAQENKGSDLWVWRQIVDFQPDKVDVLMTAYGRPTILSYEIEDNQLIFYANRPTRFSYRLIGARYDWRQWPTLAIDQTEKASLIIK